MDLTQANRVRKIAAPCKQCGKEFWTGKRDGRKREFCSNKCRQAHFRNGDFTRRYPTSGALRNVPKSPITSTACTGDFAGRPFPKVDRKTWGRIFDAEFARWWTGGREVTSPDGVTCFVVKEARR